MCGRYDNLIPREAMEQLFRVEELPTSNFPPRYNIAPTQEVPIVRIARDSHRELVFARWGLVPFFMKAMPRQPHINARAETVEKTGLYREAFAKRRCLVPATGFYEWQDREPIKQPYRIRLRSGDPFAFAGLWESAIIDGKHVRSTTILVTDANAIVRSIHDRMPVILSRPDYAVWLDSATSLPEAKGLMRPFPSWFIQSYPVSSFVNHHENDDEDCIRPIILPDRDGTANPIQTELPGL